MNINFKLHVISASLTFTVLNVVLVGCASVSEPCGCEVCETSAASMLPLGFISRAHWHAMETNGEASDFVFYRCEFVVHSVELTAYGRDHLMEVAARMPATPFPILVERSEDNSDPQLDAARRQRVVNLLTELGNLDAGQRTFVSQPYSDGQPVQASR